MAAIQSLGQVQRVQQSAWQTPLSYTGVQFYDAFRYDYAALYRMQPNVRVCVDFLARNIAQLGLHVFRRVSDTDRERLTDHGLARLLSQPLPPWAKVTRYRLIESLMADLGVYFNAYWLKLREGGAGSGPLTGLLRLPPALVTVQGNLLPTGYELSLGGSPYRLEPSEVVHFRGYNPENAIAGLSPLETLRRVLAEEHAAGQYREGFWQNSARMAGIVTRPLEAPEWSDEALERFRAQFKQLYSGAAASGETAVLEEGMDWKPVTFNAQESEYLGGRKLTREECARAYHIPLPMVGILDHATFSNVKEQHKQLYQDSLGPWLAMIEQDIELQLLPEFEDADGVYVEFNIAEKLQGSFEEQVTALQSAVGRPWMTANEARARLNLPSLGGDADQLVTPLNVLVGGLASPRDTAPDETGQASLPLPRVKGLDSHAEGLREQHERRWTEGLASHYRRQEAAIVSRVPKGRKVDIGGVWFDEERWNRELSADLLRLNNLTATAWAEALIEAGGLDVEDMEAFEAIMLPWLQEHSRIQAEYLNGQVREALTGALREPEPLEAVRGVFAAAATVWALQEARSAVTAAANFGACEAASAGGLKTKTWRVNSSNPRDAHKAMDGETVGIREKFSNNMRWPGDPAGGADNNAGCLCSVEFN